MSEKIKDFIICSICVAFLVCIHFFYNPTNKTSKPIEKIGLDSIEMKTTGIKSVDGYKL